MTQHRVVVWPWLRRPGMLLMQNWLAITIGRTIFAWRPLGDEELEHELEHVRQWRRHGPLFPLTYFGAALLARRSGKHWYQDNRFEAEARSAAAQRRSR